MFLRSWKQPCKAATLPGHLPGAGGQEWRGVPSLGMGTSWGWAGMWAWLSMVHVQAGQGCGETNPAAAMLGQGLTTPSEGQHGVLGRVGGAPGGWTGTVRPISAFRAMTSFMAPIFQLNIFKRCWSFSYWKHFLLGTFWTLSSQNKPFDHAKFSTKVVCYLCIIGLLFLGWKPCLFKCLRQYLSFKVTGANVLYLNTCQTNFLVPLLSECILHTV